MLCCVCVTRHDESDNGGETSFGWSAPYERQLTQFRSFFATATRYSLNITEVTSTGAAAAPPSTSMAALPPKSLVLIEGAEKKIWAAACMNDRWAPFLLLFQLLMDCLCCHLSCALELPFIDKDEFKMEFVSILSSALDTAKHPIVFILTTENEANDAQHVVERIFGPALLSNPKVHSIQCRPISTTELIKAINRVIQCVA